MNCSVLGVEGLHPAGCTNDDLCSSTAVKKRLPSYERQKFICTLKQLVSLKYSQTLKTIQIKLNSCKKKKKNNIHAVLRSSLVMSSIGVLQQQINMHMYLQLIILELYNHHDISYGKPDTHI